LSADRQRNAYNRPMPIQPLHSSLESLSWENRFAALGDEYSAEQAASPVAMPELKHLNADVAALIDLDAPHVEPGLFAQQLCGNQAVGGFQPRAALYAGHQFGQFVPQLGDGRAMLLGQVRNSTQQLWDLQVKGAGPTPFSRFADGRAVLRSSIREYLGSEAMYHLGVPTTRALALVTTGDLVQREIAEPGAVLARVAPSHLRFGSFEVFFYRNEHEKIRPLANYVLAEFEPDLLSQDQPYVAWLERVVDRSAEMVAHWQSVGFAHGVMNTDNMSVHGITLDYGPFGFMDAYEPSWICNHSDHSGLYAFDQQPKVIGWNVSRFAQAILPLLGDEPQQGVDAANPILESYPDRFNKHWLRLMRAKFGFEGEQADDSELIAEFLAIMEANKLDYTRSFRALAEDQSMPSPFNEWMLQYQARITVSKQGKPLDRLAHNPKYILRNHLAQKAIEQAEQGDFSEMERLIEILRRPYDDQPEHEAYAAEAPVRSTQAPISCSS
jgi:uncharacterized protein YdiU (UPF0061 family)